MSVNTTLEEVQAEADWFINANVWDGESMLGADNDEAIFTPKELQELINNMINHLAEHRYI